MPRTIDSEIGSRTLTIDDTVDNFEAGTSALPNGDFGVKTTASPNTYSFMRDRANNGDAYKFVPGQARTINFWYKGGAQNASFILGVGTQDSSSVAGSAMNWMMYTGGNALYFGVVRESNVVQNLYYGLGNTTAWEMHTYVWNPAAGSVGTVSVYFNGALAGTVSLSAAIQDRSAAACEFSFGARGNYSLSSVSPTAAVAGTMELAKLAVFDSVLSALDVSDLYISMNA